ncbi:RidA family protein [Clostridium estertheticum]|uniref:RidA family protein n=1 Tax=Clostridium estertheticum TaxID=238834 RepID=UPI001C7CC1C5|nr:RidA family protein [Clostridium estertheticum]MBX4264510.1 RidA family protein [Clostridium estertheticum]WLC88657.1 RidA family protein [Clostridium estertheticum]
MKKVIETSLCPKAIGPYSQAVITGNFMFASGQIGIDPENGYIVEGGIEAQTMRVMENIKHLLGAAEFKLEDVVKTDVFITDMDNFNIVNKIYSEYFKKNEPARSCIAIKGLPKGALIEIEIIAYK